MASRRRTRRRKTPAEKIRDAHRAKLEAARTPRIRAGTPILYRAADGRPILVKVVRQTASGRVTVRMPDKSMRSIKPRLKR